MERLTSADLGEAVVSADDTAYILVDGGYGFADTGVRALGWGVILTAGGDPHGPPVCSLAWAGLPQQVCGFDGIQSTMAECQALRSGLLLALALPSHIIRVSIVVDHNSLFHNWMTSRHGHLPDILIRVQSSIARLFIRLVECYDRVDVIHKSEFNFDHNWPPHLLATDAREVLFAPITYAPRPCSTPLTTLIEDNLDLHASGYTWKVDEAAGIPRKTTTVRKVRIRRGQTRRSQHGDTLYQWHRIELAIHSDLQMGLQHPPPRPRRESDPLSDSDHSWDPDNALGDDCGCEDF